MPIVTVKLLEGRTDEQKKALVEKVTEAVVETVNAKPEAVTIVIEEMAKNHYATGGVRASDK
ncbi:MULTISPECIES: 2-hydroxymuconate tautomerase [Lysinibacillus]|uniref:Tautomerase n=1 Tax=Lysinibacillus antri TaxID=2498145 RepID=A0A3S0RJF7_9BACI|nr:MULTISPECIES: 2-hydroxymuconate tautomerase [Lysinibacillus]RUL53126.1 4-oxalocrotonate tautomerase [Lysinibacillus antri]TSI07474.1 4-oxalocrotonate tautomerase [Lysinibacillus sp. BW-2-10]